MKDIIITKIIPKTHKSVLLFLVFTFFLGFFTFVTLLEGFCIDHLQFGGVKVEKLYLKWDNALQIKASKLDLSGIKNSGKPFTLKPLSKLLRNIRWIEMWVESIQIDIIKYKDYSGSLYYNKGKAGSLTLWDGSSQSQGSFELNETDFILSLPATKIKNGTFSTNLHINLLNQELRSTIVADLPQTPRLTLQVLGDSDLLTFFVRTQTPLTTLKPIIDFFALDPDITPWIVDYAKASSFYLNRLSGRCHYDTPQELIDTLTADATVINGAYTFAKGFEPIQSPQIDLHFRNGKLFIYPINGTFYSLPTEQSHVIIDFTAPHTLLDAYIQTKHAKLGDPILALLNFYDLHIPIKQTKGECAVDLNLSINLHDFNITSKGAFTPTSSEILLDKVLLKTEGGIVKVDHNNVTFEKFAAHYGENLAHARVNGKYNPSTKKGMVSINAYAISPLEGVLSLSSPIMITYDIAPDGDSLNVQKSQWNLFGENLILEGFRTPFDYHRAYSSIGAVPFTLSDTIKGFINASFDGIKKQTHAKLQFNMFNFGEVQLNHSPFNVDVNYSNQTAIFSVNDASSWSVHQLPILISPFSAKLRNNQIVFNDLETVLGDLFKGSFSGMYRVDDNNGVIHLNNMIPISPKMTPLINQKESLELTVDTHNDAININAPSLKAHFSTIPQGWKIGLEDISLLSKKSPILRQYNINNGYLNLFYTGKSSRFNFNGGINYPYPLMVINDLPLSHYRFSGSHQDDTSTIRVNDRLTITQTPENILIRANNVGLNLPILFKFLSKHTDNSNFSSKSEKSSTIRIYATNSYLYLMKGRKILTDTLSATLYDDNFDASLQYMNGLANLKIRNDLFSIDGAGFNDKFMEHLFALSDFSGGAFSFQAKGKTDSFDGLMRVEETTMKDYKLLNNVLAFVNTIPSLATFSLPNYNSKGLPIEDGYAHFIYKKGVVSVDNLTLNSPEIKITGTGNADISTEELYGILTLKTDLGSTLGKVPMVGYILLGDDGSLSTTLTLSGKIDNPKVDTSIAKEIVTAPFNILKRTLVYPFLWMMNDTKPKQ